MFCENCTTTSPSPSPPPPKQHHDYKFIIIPLVVIFVIMLLSALVYLMARRKRRMDTLRRNLMPLYEFDSNEQEWESLVNYNRSFTYINYGTDYTDTSI